VVNAPILPRHIYAGDDLQKHPANSAPVGSGSFKFKEWVRGDHITLVRNDRYFKAGKPSLDRLVIRIMPDPAAATIAFEKGEADYFLFPPPTSWPGCDNCRGLSSPRAGARASRVSSHSSRTCADPSSATRMSDRRWPMPSTVR
jgi:ABC-type transport system substrate-binding protein